MLWTPATLNTPQRIAVCPPNVMFTGQGGIITAAEQARATAVPRLYARIVAASVWAATLFPVAERI